MCHSGESKVKVWKDQEADTEEAVRVFSVLHIHLHRFYSMWPLEWAQERSLFWEEEDGSLMHIGVRSWSDNALTNLNLIDEHFKFIYNIWCVLTEELEMQVQTTLKAERAQLERPGELESTLWGTHLWRHCLLPQHIWKFMELKNFWEKSMGLESTMLLTEVLDHFHSNFWHTFPDNLLFYNFFIILCSFLIWNVLSLNKY